MANNPQSTGVQPVHPHVLGHAGPPNPIPPVPMQFRPTIPPPPQQFVPVPPQQFQPGGHINMGMPLPLPPHIQYPPVAPPLPPHPRSSLAGHALPQGPPLIQPDVHPNRPLMPAPAQPQISSSFMPSFGGPISSNIPYNLSSSSGGQQPMNAISAVHHQPLPLTDALNFSAGGQPWYPSSNQNIQSVVPTQQAGEQISTGHAWFSTGAQSIKPVTPLEQNRDQNAGVQQWFPNVNQQVQSGTPQKTEEQSTDVGKSVKPEPAVSPPSDWIEHTPREGKKYYYNKKTKVSSWEKPIELMTPTERADSSTDWREYISPEGRYYHNKITKISKWAMPDEVKLARERANLISCEGTPVKKDVNSYVSATVSISGTESSTPNANNLPSSATREAEPSPISVTTAATQEPEVASVLSSVQVEVANSKSETTEQHTPLELASSLPVPDTPVHVPTTTTMTPPLGISTKSPQDVGNSVKSFTGSAEETTRSSKISVSGDMSAHEGGGTTPVEGNKVDHGPVYESKAEAKSAFKALLESANVGSDWNWDQAMRMIINDRRYGALKTLGEKKQVFNEFVVQKKKQEAEEKRAKQRKAREGFKKMLQESKELTSSTRWSKAVSMFEKDDRFLAVERAKDREDLLEEHLEELEKKERAKAAEEHKRHKAEYLEFLKSCDFLKASSQWRKVQHRLEADERCLRLEKIERLEIFQEYIRDLELEEEDHRKMRMEEQRKAERKNRDEFRKLMEEHVASGILTANSHWREYCMKVKDEPSYIAVSSNTSGSTAKELFEDVLEDLEKQFLDDKEKVEEVMRSEKISLSSTWAFEDFKGALAKEFGSKSISDVNLKIIFDELMEFVKEREEKESKKRKRLTDDVYDFLFNSMEITNSSRWEDWRKSVEERFIGEESFFEEIFDRVVHDLKEKAKEKAKEKDRKRKEEKAKKEKERKEKEKKEKEREHKVRVYSKRKSKDRHKVDETDSDESESSLEESRRSRERSKKHQKRVISSYDDTSLDDDVKDHSRSHRRSSDSKKSKKIAKQTRTGDMDSESQSKRHKRGHWDGSSKNTIREERRDEDGGEDGEMQ